MNTPQGNESSKDIPHGSRPQERRGEPDERTTAFTDERVKAVFLAAKALPVDGRDAFLDMACGGSAALRSRVEHLLAAMEREPQFMASPTFEPNGPPDEQAGERLGPYKLLQRIGEGGFGVVFMAEQERPVRRRVALKIIKLGMDSKQVIARFEAERQALAMMDHPNIARVLDAGATERGRPYFVMDLVTGDPITEYCDRNRLTVPQRLRLFAQVCKAVQHAHQKGVIHRDLKPTNVLVSTQDGEPFAKVIDFGIAKATAGRLTEKTLFTEHRQLLGTPAYMSPEQAEGSLDIDTRTDVYSLGVLLYELLAGAPPFDPEQLRGAAYGELQRIIREVEPPTPSVRISRSSPALAAIAAARQVEPAKFAPMVRGGLDWIVMKALDKVRGRRYATATALAEDVERFLSGEPVEAAPASRVYRMSRFVRKHRGAVIAVASVVVALSLGIVGTTTFWVQAGNRADEADEAKSVAVRALARAELNSYATNLQAGNVAIGAEQALVAKARLEGCVDELRDWEWKHLQVLADEVPFRLPTHDSVQGFSPDGSKLLTLSADGIATVWDTRTASPTLPIKLPSNPGGLDPTMPSSGTDAWSLSFSTDGERIVGQRGDCRWVGIWSARDGDRLGWLPLGRHDGTMMAFAKDGSRVVVRSADGGLRIYPTQSGQGQSLCYLPTEKGRVVEAVHLSPGGDKALVVYGYPYDARMWDIATGSAIGPPIKDEKGWSFARVKWLDDGSGVLVVPHGRKPLWLIDATSGSRRTISREGDILWPSDVNADGTLALVLENESVYALWNLSRGERLLALEGTEHSPRPAILTPDGIHALVCAMDADDMEVPYLFDTRTGRVTRPLRGHQGQITSAAFSSDGSLVITGSEDCTARIWNVATGESMTPMVNGRPVTSCGFAPDGTRAWIVGENGLSMWTVVPQPTLVNRLEDVGVPGPWHGADAFFVMNSDRLESVDTLTGKETRLYPRIQDDEIVEARAGPDGRRAVAGTRSGRILLYDVANGREPLDTLAEPTARCHLPVFSSDGTFLLAGAEDGVVRRWRATDGEAEGVFEVAPGRSVDAWMTSPDDSCFVVRVSAGAGGTETIRDQVRKCVGGQLVSKLVDVDTVERFLRRDPWILGSIGDERWAVEISTGRRLFRSNESSAWEPDSRERIEYRSSEIGFERRSLRGGESLGTSTWSLGTPMWFDRTVRWVAVNEWATNASQIALFSARPPTYSPPHSKLKGQPCLATAFDPSSRRAVSVHRADVLGFDPMTAERLPRGEWSTEPSNTGVPAGQADMAEQERAESGSTPVPQRSPETLAAIATDDGRWIAMLERDVVRLIEADGMRAVAAIEHHADIVILPSNIRTMGESTPGDRAAPGRRSELLALSRDGSHVALADSRGQIRVWGSGASEPVLVSQQSTAPDAPGAIALSPDGTRLFLGLSGGAVRVVALGAADSPRPVTEQRISGAISALAVSADGSRIAVGTESGAVELLDAQTLARAGSLLAGPARVNALLFTPNGSRIVTASADRFIRIWHVEEALELLSLNEPKIDAEPTSIILTADGERLIAGYGDGALSVWDAVPWEARAEQIRRSWTKPQ